MGVFGEIFGLSSAVRYVSVYCSGKLESRQRDNLSTASQSESDKYEELLVNPTILTLVNQRGNIDCGGARFVLIRYGNFYQLLVALSNGHVSVCFELTSNPIDYAEAIMALF
jgi:hypothetical protein